MRDIGWRNPVSNCLLVLADAMVNLKDFKGALTTANECLTLCETGLNRHHEPHALVLKGEMLAALGQASDAERTLNLALERARGYGAGLYELRAATVLVSTFDHGVADLQSIYERMDKDFPSARPARLAQVRSS